MESHAAARPHPVYPGTFVPRAAPFLALLQQERLSADELRAICFYGIPAPLRAVFWKLLLDYLPLKKSARAAELQRKRAQYRLFLDEVTTKPGEDGSEVVAAPAPAATTAAAASSAAHATEEESSLGLSKYSSLVAGDGEQPPAAATGAASEPPPPVDAAHGGAHDGAPGRLASSLFQESSLHLFGASSGVQRGAGAHDRAAAGGSSSTAAALAASVQTPTLRGSALLAAPTTLTAHPPPAAAGRAPLAASSLTLMTVTDDPLSAKGEKHSKWAEWHRDEDLRVEIEKDISRTSPGVPFFADAANLAPMSRILFVYAKLNAGVRYVQGMNELLAPLWFVFATERVGAAARGGEEPGSPAAAAAASAAGAEEQQGGGGVADLADAEADAFFCFMGLMAEVRDVFIKAHDNSATGVKGMLGRFAVCLSRREPAVAAHLAAMRLDHQFYAFRWITTLLSREFAMPEVLVLWDAMLADPFRFSFLLHTCVGMVRLQRAAILASDFGGCMRLLQHYPSVPLPHLLHASCCVREEEVQYHAEKDLAAAAAASVAAAAAAVATGTVVAAAPAAAAAAHRDEGAPPLSPAGAGAALDAGSSSGPFRTSGALQGALLGSAASATAPLQSLSPRPPLPPPSQPSFQHVCAAFRTTAPAGGPGGGPAPGVAHHPGFASPFGAEMGLDSLAQQTRWVSDGGGSDSEDSDDGPRAGGGGASGRPRRGSGSRRHYLQRLGRIHQPLNLSAIVKTVSSAFVVSSDPPPGPPLPFAAGGGGAAGARRDHELRTVTHTAPGLTPLTEAAAGPL